MSVGSRGNRVIRLDDQTFRKTLDDQIEEPLFVHLAVRVWTVVGRGGLEPPTSRLSGVRSNHLSYRPS